MVSRMGEHCRELRRIARHAGEGASAAPLSRVILKRRGSTLLKPVILRHGFGVRICPRPAA